MSSICYGGSVRMSPEVVNTNIDPMFEEGYPYSIPKVYLQGTGEFYNRQRVFNWDDDSVVEIRGKRLVRYTYSRFLELLAKNEKGEIVWMDGRYAPYSDCWEGEYLDEVRGAGEYHVEEYDFETLEKRRYKVTLDETSKFDVETLYGLYDFLDSEVIGSNFVIKDGVLKKYFGESRNLIIPDGVTEIGHDPFVSVHDFDIIVIPKTLVDISSFISKCTTKSISVDKDNSKYYSKDGCLIDKESGTLVWAFAAKSVPEDELIKDIGVYAFAGRKDIERIEIPENITKIGTGAFCGCVNLTSIEISDSTAVIDGRVFSECESLLEIKLPSDLKVIKDNTFSGCTSLTSIEIPNSVQSMERFAFWSCGSLSEIRTSGVGIVLSEIISGASYVRNGDEWAIDTTTNNRNFSDFNF